ncbi:hypothetical protein Hypma_012727 [Hypsizygus marmoreus]|uniref:Uncharacterized protein n=1 Tax=Hypsizygus marmoreus TaxID=39966 RepID=A0A369JL90_HYPMA|nr:hypothetical protein Hypma_012727 [Hypsizygus marmoreus]
MPNVQSTLTYTPFGAIRRLENVLHDSTLKTLFHGVINPSILTLRLSRFDINARLDYGTTIYSVDPTAAAALWNSVKKIAQVIHCAAYDINPYTSNRPLPPTLPLDHLASLGLRAPSCSIALSVKSGQAPLGMTATNCDVLYDLIAAFQQMATYYLEWLARAIETSLAQGLRSRWNWGAYWGINWEEFMDRAQGRINDEAIEGIARIEAIDNSHALILHPTHSRTARRARRRAPLILNGRIPVDRSHPISQEQYDAFMAQIMYEMFIPENPTYI